jgi:hypothetical protein
MFVAQFRRIQENSSYGNQYNHRVVVPQVPFIILIIIAWWQPN